MSKTKRSQRKKEYREKRHERVLKNLEGKNAKRRKLSRANKITLMMIFMVVIVLFVLQRNTKSFSTSLDFTVETFESAYSQFVEKEEDFFKYDKKIEEIIKNKNEYSYLQKSSKKTNSLIALYEDHGKVKQIGVVGKNNFSEDFYPAYAENMIVVFGLVCRENYEVSEKILIKNKILDKDGKIAKRDKVLNVKFDDSVITFDATGENFIFNIQNK